VPFRTKKSSYLSFAILENVSKELFLPKKFSHSRPLSFLPLLIKGFLKINAFLKLVSFFVKAVMNFSKLLQILYRIGCSLLPKVDPLAIRELP
jgi:hypothetical protein